MKKKKILHILVLPKLAGSQRISLSILESLPDDQFEKWVLFSSTGATESEKEVCKQAFERNNVQVIFSDNLKREICFSDLKAITEIYNLCRKYKFDIVHTHSTKPGIVGRIAASFARTSKVIHTVHGLAFHDFLGKHKWLFYFLCEQFACLFCTNIVLVNKFYSRHFKLFSKKVMTIYNGVDFSSKPMFNFDQRNSKITKLLFVGRLDEAKDPLTLITTMDYLINNIGRKDLSLTIVGDGAFYDKMVLLAKNNGLFNKNVFFEGWQDCIDKYYVSHDIFFMPSIYESFGLVLLDAGYYQLASVASSVEGIPEVIVDGVTGLLSDPKDYIRFSENILRLVDDPEFRFQMGINARENALSKFHLNNMISEYINLYLS